MKIFINGESFIFTKNSNISISNALERFIKESQAQLSYAVAINSTFVSKEHYATTTLKDDDTLDVLFPIVGG